MFVDVKVGLGSGLDINARKLELGGGRLTQVLNVKKQCSMYLAITWLTLAALGIAYARCDNVLNQNDCTKKDFEFAASINDTTVKQFKEDGGWCNLLFINSRYDSCVEARKTIKTDISCGPNGQSPPGCAARQDNKKLLKRWQKCLDDRLQQQKAFANGRKDVLKAKQRRDSRQIGTYLKTIDDAIKIKESGHAEEIRGVKITVNNCKKFPDAQ